VTSVNEDAANLTSNGLRLPAWAVGGIAALLVTGAGFIARSQQQLGYLEREVAEIKSSLRTDIVDMRNAIGVVQINTAKICATVKAGCD